MRLCLSFIFSLVLFISGFLVCGCSQFSKMPKPVGVKPETQFAPLTWVKDLDPAYRPGKLPIGLSSPVIDKGRILTGTAAGELIEVNLSNLQEKVIWKSDAPIYAPVLVDGDMYYIGNLNGDLIGWSTNDGKEKFKVNLGAPIESPMSIQGGRIIVPVRSHSVVCLDALTGKILWTYKRPVAAVKTLQRRAGALLIGKYAIMGFADGYLVSFRLEDGNVHWESKVTESESRHFQDVIATPTYFEGRILTHSYQGYLKAYKLDTGALDRTILEKPTSNYAIKDGSIYFANTLGNIIKVNSKFEVSTHFQQLSPFAIFQIHLWNNLFVLNDHKGSVYWINAEEQNQLKKKFFLGHAYSTVYGPIASDQLYLTLISSRNRLYLFQKELF